MDRAPRRNRSAPHIPALALVGGEADGAARAAHPGRPVLVPAGRRGGGRGVVGAQGRLLARHPAVRGARALPREPVLDHHGRPGRGQDDDNPRARRHLFRAEAQSSPRRADRPRGKADDGVCRGSRADDPQASQVEPRDEQVHLRRGKPARGRRVHLRRDVNGRHQPRERPPLVRSVRRRGDVGRRHRPAAERRRGERARRPHQVGRRGVHAARQDLPSRRCGGTCSGRRT